MKTSGVLLKGALTAVIALFSLSACQKNDSSTTPRVKTYNIVGYPGYNVSGTATFKEVLNTDSVMLTVNLQGSDVTNVSLFPLYIREGTSLEKGPVKFKLGNLDGSVGSLQKELNLSFSDLLNLNGSLDIYRNTTDTNQVIAQGEIGANEIFKSFNMYSPLDANKINGQFRVYKRATGAYIVIGIDTAVAKIGGMSHPARVYKSDGTRDFDLSDVSATTGVSSTSVTDHTFDDLIHYTGMIKVLESQDMQDVTISQGKFN